MDTPDILRKVNSNLLWNNGLYECYAIDIKLKAINTSLDNSLETQVWLDLVWEVVPSRDQRRGANIYASSWYHQYQGLPL